MSCLITAFLVNGARAQEIKADSIIIKVKKEFQYLNLNKLYSLDKLNKNNQVTTISALSHNKNSLLYGAYEINFSNNKDIKALARQYQNNLYIEYAEPKYHLSTHLFSPNDTYYSEQWNLSKINTPEAWDYDSDSNPYGGDSSVKIAVLDTGVSYENYETYVQAPDLANTNFVSGYDFVNNDNHANDDNGHGTNITEIIAASTNNAKGIAGIAFNVSIMPVKVMDGNGEGSIIHVASGIEWAVNHGADIINMSIGTGEEEFYSETLYDAVKYAQNNEVILLSSTGNDGVNRIYYPAAYPEVIAIGASNSSNTLASFSNYGQGIDLVAPGTNILAEYCNNNCSDHNLVSASGTSQAVPHISAAAGLLFSYGSSSNQIKALLTSSTQDLGASGYDTSYGYGLLDIEAALALAQSDSGKPTTSLNVSPSEPDGENGYYVSQPRISLTASDENGIKNIYYRLNSGSWQTYTSSFSLSEGKHLIEYYAKDNINNSEITKSTNIYVDLTAPSLSLSRPFNNQKVNGSFLISSGQITDQTSGVLNFSVNNQSFSTDSANYSENISLSKGKNNLTFILKDRAGHNTTIQRSVFSYKKNNILIGKEKGDLPLVQGYDSDNQLTGAFLPYTSALQGGVNIIAADINNDGSEEIITAPGSGGGPHVRVLNSRAQEISWFMAYLNSFRGGVNLAAGDVDGDGQTEIITAAGPGGGPHIRVFDYQGHLKSQFFAYAENFRGGVQIACGDTDGDGISEIITGAGSSGGPHVKVFDYQGNVKEWFMAYAENFRGGVNLTTGDLDSDGSEEIITAPLSNGGPHVRIFNEQGDLEDQFFVYSSDFRGGLNLSTGDYDNDGTYEIITAVKSGLKPEVKIFEMDGSFISNFYLFPGFSGGINVAGFN